MEEIADRLRKIIEADERKRNGQKISQYEREDLEKNLFLNTQKKTTFGLMTSIPWVIQQVCEVMKTQS